MSITQPKALFPNSSVPSMFFRLASCLMLLMLSTVLTAQTGWPRSLVDTKGYRLTLKAPPQAIASLTLASDEILYDLVDHSRLKALTYLVGDPGISCIAERAKGFPLKLSGEKEQIIAAQPDLVIVADWKESAFVQSLRDAGLSVFVFNTPGNFDELRSTLRLMGSLCGTEAKAAQMIAEFEGRLQAVNSRLRHLRPSQHLSILSYSFYGTTYARGTSFDTVATAAGLVNIASQAGLKDWPQLSKEQIIALDPDIILLPSWSYEGRVNAHNFRSTFMADPIFARLKAVRQGRVFNLSDAHLMANSQYMAVAVEDLARAAYPELFK